MKKLSKIEKNCKQKLGKIGNIQEKFSKKGKIFKNGKKFQWRGDVPPFPHPPILPWTPPSQSLTIPTYPKQCLPILDHPHLSGTISTYQGPSLPIPNHPHLSKAITTYPELSPPILNHHCLSQAILAYPGISWAILNNPSPSQAILVYSRNSSKKFQYIWILSRVGSGRVGRPGRLEKLRIKLTQTFSFS